MGPAELLENIRRTKNLVINIEQLADEYAGIIKKPLTFANAAVGFIAWIVFLVQTGLSDEIIRWSDKHIFNPFIAPLDLPKVMNVLLVSTDIIVFHLVNYLLLVKLTNAYLVNKHIQKKSSRLKIIQSQINEGIRELQDSIIPPDYQKADALTMIESYVMHQRADTLKECLNLYDQDIKHEENMEALGNLAAAQYETARQVEKARSEAARHRN